MGFGHGRGHTGQGHDPIGRRRNQALVHAHGPIDGLGHQGAELGALAHGLTQALRHQGLVFAQVRAHHQHALHGGQRRQGATQPTGGAVGTHVAEVGGAQARIDVLAAQATHQSAGQSQLFDGAVGAGQKTDAVGTMVGFDLLQPIGHVFQGGLPIDRFPFAALLEHGLGQAVFAVQGFIGVTVAVGDPAFVDGVVFQRHHAHDAVVLDLNDQVGAGGVVRAHALAAREFPGAGLVTEGFAGERAHGADVDHVAREFGVHRLADKSFDLGVLAAVAHAELHHAGDFLTEAHAAGAVDAAAHLFHRHERAHVFVEDHAFFFFVTRL